MKKFLIFLSFLALLPFSFSFKPEFLELTQIHQVIFSNIDYCVYSLGVVHSNQKSYTIIDNGSSVILKGDINYAKKMKENAKDIMGESITFRGLKSGVKSILNFYNLKQLKYEEFDNIISIYGYSDKLCSKNNIIIDNNKVNMQIVFNDGFITVGTPIILGEY